MEAGKQPTIAVYMSCYNHEKYVAEAMESIINQTYPHWELFVANDGSTDRSGEIIASYKDERIHFYDLSENTQLVGAMNLLFDEIRDRSFDYVHSMASDDLLDVHKFEKQIAFFREHPQYAACFTWDKVIFSDGSLDYDTDYSHLKNRSRYAWLDRFFLQGNCLNANSAMVRKDVFYELDTMNQRYIVLADFRLWYMIAAHYPVYMMEEPLTYYRRHATNLSNTTFESAVCTTQEDAKVVGQVIGGMDSDTFRRAYYMHLPYRYCHDEDELTAAKFILLVNNRRAGARQAAIDYYYENCGNRRFIHLLKEQYLFGNGDFTFLKQHAGLPFTGNDIAVMSESDPLLPQAAPRFYRSFQILMQAVRTKQCDGNSLGRFNYSGLRELCILSESSAEMREQFRIFKALFQKMRSLHLMSLKKRKILFVVAVSSDWRIDGDRNPFAPDPETSFYLTCIHPMDIRATEDMPSLRERGLAVCKDPDTAEYVELFDDTNQGLLFGDEVIPDLTDVCYVDCLGEEYECSGMTAGYALSCAQYCIIDRKTYEEMERLPETKAVTGIMDEVYCYETPPLKYALKDGVPRR